MSQLESKDLNFSSSKCFVPVVFLLKSAACITFSNSHQASHNFSYIPVISVHDSALGILNSPTC